MSEERHPNNLVAMLLALIPGLSQVYLEHVLLGAIFFSAFLTALNCLFLAGNLQSATNTQLLGQISLLSLIVIWIGSAWHAYALSYGTDRSGLARDRGQLLRMALLDYLKNDLEPAAVKLERAIELDVDWQDPDPLFHLGVVLLRLAEERALDQDGEGSRVARRRSQWAFRTCLGRDRFGKWRREIRRETKRMRTLLERSGRGTSERLDMSDTTIASFPELGESTSLPRPPLGPDSSRYPRITPRPFSRRLLKERLEASGLEADTVAAMPPEDQLTETEAERLTRESEETRLLPPRGAPGSAWESSNDTGSGDSGLGDSDLGDSDLGDSDLGDSDLGDLGLSDLGGASEREGELAEEEDLARPEDAERDEAIQRQDQRRPKRKTRTRTETKVEEPEAEHEAEVEPGAKPVAKAGAASAGGSQGSVQKTSAEEDLAATQPAERLLPGEEGAFAGASSSEEEASLGALVTEDGIPATRLDVRPRDLIADLLPATRQHSRDESEKGSEGLTPYPPTRTISRIRVPGQAESGGESRSSEIRLPPTRHVSRAAVGALRAKLSPGDDAASAALGYDLWVALDEARCRPGPDLSERMNTPVWDSADPQIAEAWAAITAPENLKMLEERLGPHLNETAREATQRALKECQGRQAKDADVDAKPPQASADDAVAEASGEASDAETGGAETAETGGAETGGAETGGAETGEASCEASDAAADDADADADGEASDAAADDADADANGEASDAAADDADADASGADDADAEARCSEGPSEAAAGDADAGARGGASRAAASDADVGASGEASRAETAAGPRSATSDASSRVLDDAQAAASDETSPPKPDDAGARASGEAAPPKARDAAAVAVSGEARSAKADDATATTSGEARSATAEDAATNGQTASGQARSAKAGDATGTANVQARAAKAGDATDSASGHARAAKADGATGTTRGQASEAGSFSRPSRAVQPTPGSEDDEAASQASTSSQESGPRESLLGAPEEQQLEDSIVERGMPPTRAFVSGAHLEAPEGFDEVSVEQLRAKGALAAGSVLEEEDPPETDGEGSQDEDLKSPNGGGGAQPPDAGGSQPGDAAGPAPPPRTGA